MNWYESLLLGGGIGLVLGTPILYGIVRFIKNLRERLSIKKQIREGKFLIPIDAQDYDVKAWKEIDNSIYQKEVEGLDKKIFKKTRINQEDPFKEVKNEITPEFRSKVIGYMLKAREMGYDDNFIVTEFRKKNYPEKFISEVING